MYNFISLHLNCPVCNKSLMDNGKQIDNEPSVNVLIKQAGQSGHIWLSSVYGSYNHFSEVEIQEDKVAEFFCPHCKSQLMGKLTCKLCQAPMTDFNLDMGGRVSICSRSGCKNHAIEFEDLGLALKELHEQYGFHEGEQQKHSTPAKSRSKTELPFRENTEIIETGTSLQAYCPHCHKSLIDNNMLRLKISNNEEGDLYLSPYLNVFTSKSTIFLPENTVAKDLQCFHCNHTLIAADKSCGKCGSPTARIFITARTKFIDFYICTKKGCRWHGLNEDDLFEIRLEDSTEW